MDTPKVAVVALAATVTEDGAVSAPAALFVRPTVAPPAGAALDSVTLQLAVLFHPKAFGEQLKAVTFGGDCKETVANAVEPFSVAVSVTV